MNNFDFRGQKVLVMGLGILGGGVSAASFFIRHKAQVTVTDLRSEKELQVSLKRLKQFPLKFVLGQHRQEDFFEADLIIKNPAVADDNPYLKMAKKLGKKIEMESSLFAKLCPVPIVGVTGTRGKSTTSAMIYAILKSYGQFPVFLGGNHPDSSTLELLDKITPDSLVVLELSSWQLAGFHEDQISPHLAVFTNFYPDHLNRYQSQKDYLDDKKAIFLYQKKGDYLLLNQEDSVVKKLAKEAPGQVLRFDANYFPAPWKLQIPGEHNRLNAAAALRVAELLKVPKKVIKKALEEFPGLTGRLEKVRQIKNISFINDTTSTTPVATAAAIKALGRQRIVLLLGGNDKNLPLEYLIKALKRPAVTKIILLPGTGTEKLLKQIKKEKEINNKIAGQYEDFKQAVVLALKLAQPKNTVLLSPGFTSFAAFRNEFDRGEQFKKIVREL